LERQRRGAAGRGVLKAKIRRQESGWVLVYAYGCVWGGGLTVGFKD